MSVSDWSRPKKKIFDDLLLGPRTAMIIPPNPLSGRSPTIGGILVPACSADASFQLLHPLYLHTYMCTYAYAHIGHLDAKTQDTRSHRDTVDIRDTERQRHRGTGDTETQETPETQRHRGTETRDHRLRRHKDTEAQRHERQGDTETQRHRRHRRHRDTTSHGTQ